MIGGRPISQFRPNEKSIYQPSVSIRCLIGLQASGEDSIAIVVLTWRAWNPNISLRSPVSIAVVVKVITPPLRDGPEVLAMPPPLFAVAASVSIGVTTYFLALSLI